jgi:hypothetical protein
MTYIPEPNDPRELSRPQVDPRRANQMYGKKIRNTIGQIGFMAGGIGLLAAIFDGRPIWLVVGIAAFCFSLVGLARAYRGQATNKRETQLGVLLAIATIAVGLYWGHQSEGCTFVNVDQQVACIKDHVGVA